MNNHEIGDLVWVYDPNRRIYARSPETGKTIGPPIYRESFLKFQIISETKTSWVVGRHDSARVVAKIAKEGKPSGTIMAFSEQELDDLCFVHDNRHKISHHVLTMTDATTLREIARISGFDEKLVERQIVGLEEVAPHISR